MVLCCECVLSLSLVLLRWKFMVCLLMCMLCLMCGVDSFLVVVCRYLCLCGVSCLCLLVVVSVLVCISVCRCLWISVLNYWVWWNSVLCLVFGNL